MNGKPRKKKRGRVNRNREGIKLGVLNINGIGKGKLEDLEELWKQWGMEIVGLTETHLRRLIKWEGDTYNLMGKGREKTQKKGGGVAIMIRNNSGWETEQAKVSEGSEKEDVMAVKSSV